MIVKPFDETQPLPRDKLRKAGRIAEMQMARHLRNEFAAHPEVFVFNDLRFEHGGRTAQIDHLVMHPFGFVIIESKSVHGSIQVNRHGEFSRTGNFRKMGMDSPLRQATRQMDLLRDLLAAHYPQRLRRLSAKFHEGRFKVLVAISRTGEIKRIRCNPPELLKADAVPEKIAEIIDRYRRAPGQGNREYRFAKYKDIEQIRDFLLERDVPRQWDAADLDLANAADSDSADSLDSLDFRLKLGRLEQPARPEPADQADTVEAAADLQDQDTERACRNCDSSNINIMWNNRYKKYVFECDDCGAETWIKVFCETCGAAARVSKSKLKFTKKCKVCETAEPYFTNSREDAASFRWMLSR